eukprot:TRINITY_DN42131_c0_g1_i1.p1 TRINITY_DN42131_c0_g1~~TRINITY_DN42131_c0_g1_i1.p1  ORF type:complete len:1387 (-),score=248.39 TRINITY_DN42131_c0_g1_i1:9-4130(-)
MRVAPQDRRAPVSKDDSRRSFFWPAATALALLLNLFCLAQWPFLERPRKEHPNLEEAGQGWSLIQATELSEAKLLRPRQNALSADCQSSAEGASEGAAAPKVEFSTWADLENPLFRLDASSLRLLPPPGPEGDKIAEGRRWITFGLSSIKRPKTSYLGITLSRLFDVMELEAEPTAVLVHLADFNEAWVQEEATWLLNVFTDQVHEGRLHAIHAPQSLYPLKQVPLSGVTLQGFHDPAVNARFACQSERQLAGRPTYWTETHFLYWCLTSGSMDHRRWGIAEVAEWEEVKQGNCKFWVKAPTDVDVLDPRVTGWEERSGEKWVISDTAGVASVDLQEGETAKFGDGPQRQWWRSKQNLDYAFLMWYAANVSEYYMQLEDDVQPVPHFAAGVRSYIERSLLAEPWLMASFSSMGFIGKLFNATRLPQLAQVLLTFNTESPCDWLVWEWIDAISDKGFSGDTPGEVEEKLKLGKEVRQDLQLYYMAPDMPKLFLTEPATKDVTKPSLLSKLNGQRGAKHPVAFAFSSMDPYRWYTEDKAYPPGDPMGFWTSDTEVPPPDPTNSKQHSDAFKYFQLMFKRPVDVVRIEIHQGRPGHEDDYMREAKLKVGFERSCKTMDTILEMSKPLEVWEGSLPQEVECLRIYLTKSQQQWIAIRDIVIVTRERQALFSPSTSALPIATEAKGGTAAHSAILHALTAAGIGLLAGTTAWLAVWQTRERWERLGGFGCWASCFAVVLDIGLMQTLAPMQEDSALQHPMAFAGADKAASEKKVMLPQKPPLPPGHLSELPRKPCGSGVLQPRLQIDWRAMTPGIAAVHPDQLHHLGPGSDPRSTGSSSSSQRKFMSVGIVADASMDANSVAEAALQLARSGRGKAIVAVLVSPRDSSKGGKTDRASFVEKLRTILGSAADLSEASLLHLLEPSENLYPPPPLKTKNIDIAMLSMFLAPLAHNFMQVEPLCSMVQDYADSIRTYTEQLDNSHTPWIVVQFTKDGYLRKLIRSRLVHRWAELLVIFPDIPADALFWNFVDIVGDVPVPKALYIGTVAERHQRFDVKVQYVMSEPLLEHLGDMSSLQGKVQRVQERFFKDHVLSDNLFDNPPGIMRTSLRGREDMLQSMYDGSPPQASVNCGNMSAKTCGECPYFDGAGCTRGECSWGGGLCTSTFNTEQVLDEPSSGEAWIELVFDDGPKDVEIVNLRMGGQLVPIDCKDGDCSQAEKPDANMDHALDDAELLFGHGVADTNKKGVGCARYVRMRHVSGREVFWRTASSRPAKGVRCIMVSAQRAQRRPLIFRHFQVRSTDAGKRRVASKALDHVGPSPSVARRAPQGLRAQQLAISDTQQVQRLTWFLVVSLACVSGAFGGVFGALFDTVRPRRKRRQ